jgi:hypothetical protein
VFAYSQHSISVWKTPATLLFPLHFRLKAEFDRAIGRQLEQVHCAVGIADHHGEELFAPKASYTGC